MVDSSVNWSEAPGYILSKFKEQTVSFCIIFSDDLNYMVEKRVHQYICFCTQDTHNVARLSASLLLSQPATNKV